MMLLPLIQSGLSGTLDHSPLVAVATLFGAGVLTSLTPCVYPLIPITAGVVAGAAGQDAPRVRMVTLTLAYVSGLALLYACLGLLAGLSGSLFGTISANPWVRLGVGNILLVFGLVMLDVIPLRMPQGLTQWASRLGGGSYPAVFLLGATSGIQNWCDAHNLFNGRFSTSHSRSAAQAQGVHALRHGNFTNCG